MLFRSYSTGIYIDIFEGNFTNTGTINVEGQRIAEGIYIYEMLGNSVFNQNGDINVKATNSGSVSSADGLYIEILESNTTTNIGGNINVSADSDIAFASGVSIDELYGDVTLFGNINTDVKSSSPVFDAYGVGVYNIFDGTITNKGTVTSTVSQNGIAYSLFAPSSGTGSFINDTTGVLNGAIAILNSGINFNNRGKVNIGTTIDSSIAGNYEQSGTLGVNLVDNSNYSKLNVAGTANLDNSTIHVSNSSTTIGDTFTDVVKAGTLSTTNLKVTDDKIFYNYDATIDGNAIDFKVTQGESFDSILSSFNLNSNVAAFWDKVFVNGTSNSELNSLLNSLKSMGSASEVQKAIKSTLPNNNQASNDATNSVGGKFGNIVSNRQEGVRGQSGISSGDEIMDRNFWLKPFYSKASQDNVGSNNGYKANSYGLVAGFDEEMDSQRIGIAMALSKSKVDVNETPSTNEIDGYNFMLYGSSPIIDEVTNLDWQVGVGFHKNDSSRYVSANAKTASASYDSSSVQLSFKASRDYKVDGKTTLLPYVKTSFQYLKNDSYSESGADPLNLNVKSSSSKNLFIGLGTSIEHKIDEKFKFGAKAGLNYNLLNDVDTITSSYAADTTSSFSTKGIKQEPLNFESGVNVNYKKDDLFDIDFSYDMETTNGFINNSVSAKLNWKF